MLLFVDHTHRALNLNVKSTEACRRDGLVHSNSGVISEQRGILQALIQGGKLRRARETLSGCRWGHVGASNLHPPNTG